MKIKKITAIVLTFILCFGVLTFAFADETAEVPEGYTPIYTAEDLYNIRNNLAGKYILMNDIDLSVYENWEPIGTSEKPFTGELDGNGYSISNMAIKGEYTGNEILYFSLFSFLENSTISNLNIIDTDINVIFTGTTIKQIYAGSLGGYGNCVALKNCVVSGNIKIDGFRKGVVGGFVGKENMWMLVNCVSYVDISVTNAKSVVDLSIGGISGVSTYGTMSQCCNYGNITLTGIDSESESRELKVGGIQGECADKRSTIIDCYNRGDINLNFSTPSTYVGGIIGECFIAENCYNTGEIVVPNNYAGYAGGISGDFWTNVLAVEPSPYMKNIYYLNEGFYPAYVNSSTPHDDFDNAKLLTTDEMKKQESFVGFDFDTVWTMEENGYPVLQNQPVLPERIPETPSTESTTETTTGSPTESTTEPTTEPSTENTTEPSTESTTEPTTEPSTEPSDDECPLANLWIVRAINRLLNLIWNTIIPVFDCLK